MNAVKRLKNVHWYIENLISPNSSLIFSRAVRDKLLLNSEKFTQSRMYFWHSQLLKLMNNRIERVVNDSYEVFNEQFWSGNHEIIWPCLEDNVRNKHWRRQLTNHRSNFEKAIAELKEVQRLNEDKVKLIAALRDELSLATNLLES